MIARAEKLRTWTNGTAGASTGATPDTSTST
jgi:hypothetical protein